MSHVFDISISPMGQKAGADLTAQQYTVVRHDTSTADQVLLSTGASTRNLGVLQNSPSSGQEAEVAVLGPAKAKLRVNACDLAAGVYLGVASDAALEPLTASGPAFAKYMGAPVTSGSILGQVLLFGGTILAASRF